MAKFAILTAVIALMACSSPQEMGDAVGVAAPENGEPVAENAEPRVVAVENEQMNFSFSWPAKAAAMPALNAVFEALAKSEQDGLAALTDEAQADAKQYGYPFIAYDFSKDWEVAGDTPRFLSLAAGIYAYTGGAHPNSWFDSMVWDRDARKEMEQTELFTSLDALEAAVREDYCAGLRDERVERLGGKGRDYTDIFDGCPELDELVVVLESSDGAAFDAINLMAAPYVAGSYVEGPYEVKVPVTQAVIDAAKPEYRAAFSLGS